MRQAAEITDEIGDPLDLSRDEFAKFPVIYPGTPRDWFEADCSLRQRKPFLKLTFLAIRLKQKLPRFAADFWGRDGSAALAETVSGAVLTPSGACVSEAGIFGTVRCIANGGRWMPKRIKRGSLDALQAKRRTRRCSLQASGRLLVCASRAAVRLAG